MSPPDNTDHTGTYPGTPLYTPVSTWDGLVRTGGVPSTTLQMFAGRPRDSDRENIVQVDKSFFLGLRSNQERIVHYELRCFLHLWSIAVLFIS